MSNQPTFRTFAARSIFLLAALTIASAGCGDDESSNPDARVDLSHLSGAWISEDCEPTYDDQGGVIYKTREYSFDDDTWTLDLVVYFDDATCTVPAMRVLAGGTIDLRGDAERVSDATRAFFAFTAREVVPTSAQAAEFMNELSVCQRTDWQADTTVDVHESGCLDLNVPPVATCPGEYDAIRYTDDKLYLGERTSDNANTACLTDNYPSQLIEFALVRRP